jgi:Tol biopolymer transport system component/tRNA A-37 threonylcarbamoyl transferase component Bud32
MSPERLLQVEELYHSARERAPEEREAFLAQADPELRREVESLLAQDGESVLDRPAMEIAAKLLEDSSGERLVVGSQLGPYKIESSIGAGGMGQVYKARDTRLGRAVAIKVSSHQFNARFEREARAISALNHPHICTLHDIGPNYLVMELVEGPTLAERLKKGPLPVESVLRYGAQVADALAAAHAQGIVHRDLKPGNIMITKSGVKVLDFGLAKSPQDETLTSSQVVMGSPAYMAPEQREGKACDARTDIYALGLVLYEMATAKRAAPDQPGLTDNLPEGLAHVIQRCLDTDPEQRWQSARDIRAELEWVARARTSGPVSTTGLSKWVWMTVIAVVGLVAAVFTFAYFMRKPPDIPMVRFSFAPPFKADALDVAVSPDGKLIAFADADGGSSLWLRPVDSLISQKLPGTESAVRPFWSPDGHSLGFVGSDGLKRVELGGVKGSVQTVTAFATNGGGAWSPKGIILYQPEATGAGLYRVPAGGGVPVPATKLNSERKEIVHRYPQFLPDGRHFIYWVWSASQENTGIYAGSIDPQEKLPDGPLVRTWREARYAEPGYLLWLRGSTLVAQRFDTGRLTLIGEPFSLPEPVGMHWGNTGRAMFSASQGSIFVYQESLPQPGAKFVWRDRRGNQIRAIEAPPGSSLDSLDPDEKRLVVYHEDENALEDLWVVELDRATISRLTTTHSSSMNGAWSPDGRRIGFQSNRNGVYDLYAKDASGVGEEELLVKSAHTKAPTGWSPDGRFLVYREADPTTKLDIWVLPMEGERKPFPFLKTEYNESNGSLSPVPDSHGRLWMAYDSDDTGRAEIYLRPFVPGTPERPAGAEVRVSTGGGHYPQWRRDARELFYSAGNKLIAVDVKLGQTPEIGGPTALFEAQFTREGNGWTPFADGRRFLFVEPVGEPPAPKINVVLNWMAELKR